MEGVTLRWKGNEKGRKGQNREGGEQAQWIGIWKREGSEEAACKEKTARRKGNRHGGKGEIGQEKKETGRENTIERERKKKGGIKRQNGKGIRTRWKGGNRIGGNSTKERE